MPYVPTIDEVRRLRRAIDRAQLSEAERIGWLSSFALLLVAGAIIATISSRSGIPVLLTAGGLVGFVFGLFVLYWRLRGVFAAEVAPESERSLHSIGLRTRDQRAFTALMLRHAFTGKNPLTPSRQHDPLAEWRQRNAEVGVRSED